MKLCKECGVVEIVERRTFCRACGEERRREQSQENARRQRARMRPNPQWAMRPNPQRKVRTCLTCGKGFLSDGPGNRRCRRCKRDPIYLSGCTDRYRYWGPLDYLDPTIES